MQQILEKLTSIDRTQNEMKDEFGKMKDESGKMKKTLDLVINKVSNIENEFGKMKDEFGQMNTSSLKFW